MKHLRFASLFLLLALALLVPWLTKGQLSAKVADPIGLNQPVFDNNEAASIASDGVLAEVDDEIMTSMSEESSQTSLPLPNMLPPTPTPIAYPYPGPTPQPLDSLNVQATASQETINLSWELDGPFAGDLQTYTVYRRAGSTGNFEFLGHTQNSQYTDNDSSLQSEVEYCYQVEALGVYGFVVATSDIACASFGSLTIVVPHQVLPPNSQDQPVTINLANGNGLCIRALDIKIQYNNAIVKANSKVSPTVFTQNYAFEANTTADNEVKISAIIGGSNCVELYGAGSLFDVFFDVVGNEGDVTPVDFITGLTGTVIYDEDDLNTPVLLNPQNGSLTIGSTGIRGDVNGDGAVNAADAALALDIASGLIEPTNRQLTACDVNADGACNSADSSLILCFAANQDWAQCGGVETVNRLRQSNAQPNADPVVVKIGELSQSGSTLTVPVEISHAADMAGGNFSFMYDTNKMVATGASLTSLTSGFEIETNREQAGIFKVSLARENAIGGEGAVLLLQFTVNSGISSINFGSITLNNAAGQDFQTSALQREIQLVPYINLSVAQNALYLPLAIGGE